MKRMVVSMTGFGETVIEYGNHQIEVQIKTINHRYFDFNLRTDMNLWRHEEQLKRHLKEKLVRGRVELSIRFKESQYDHFSPGEAWYQMMDQQIQQIKQTYPDTYTYMLDHFPDYNPVQAEQGITLEDLSPLVPGIERAIADVLVMREKEGFVLFEELSVQLNEFDHVLAWLKTHQDRLREQHYLRMVERAERLLQKQNIYDKQPVYQELASLSEKGDVTEEWVRIESHVKHIRELLGQSGMIGRKIDFYLQEMMREVNTIGAKANDERLANHVVNLKSTIEKIKEQVQNIQ